MFRECAFCLHRGPQVTKRFLVGSLECFRCVQCPVRLSYEDDGSLTTTPVSIIPMAEVCNEASISEIIVLKQRIENLEVKTRDLRLGLADLANTLDQSIKVVNDNFKDLISVLRKKNII